MITKMSLGGSLVLLSVLCTTPVLGQSRTETGAVGVPVPAPEPSSVAQAQSPTPAADAGVAKPRAPKKGAQGPAQVARRRVREGDQLFKERRFRDASFAFQDAVNADPQNLEALFKLGNAYAVLGYYPQAIDRWSRVAASSPDPVARKSAQDNIAKAQAKMAEGGAEPQPPPEPEPSAIADRAREAARAEARAAYEAGVVRVNQRDFLGAIPSFTRALQLDPTLEAAHIARGSANIGLRRYVEAVSDYQAALRLRPESATPLYGLAEAYRGLGRTAEARELYQRYAASTSSDLRPELVKDAQEKALRLR